jgi:hypothetical protein
VFESTALPLWQKTLTILLFFKMDYWKPIGPFRFRLQKAFVGCLKVYGILVLKDLIILFFDAIILKCPALVS